MPPWGVHRQFCLWDVNIDLPPKRPAKLFCLFATGDMFIDQINLAVCVILRLSCEITALIGPNVNVFRDFSKNFSRQIRNKYRSFFYHFYARKLEKTSPSVYCKGSFSKNLEKIDSPAVTLICALLRTNYRHAIDRFTIRAA